MGSSFHLTFGMISLSLDPKPAYELQRCYERSDRERERDKSSLVLAPVDLMGKLVVVI